MSKQISIQCPTCKRATYGILSGNLSVVCESIPTWRSVCVKCGQEKCPRGCTGERQRWEIVSESPGCGERVYVCGRCGLRRAIANRGKIVCVGCGVRDRTTHDKIKEGITFSQACGIGFDEPEYTKRPEAIAPQESYSAPPAHAIKTAMPLGPPPKKWKPPAEKAKRKKKA